MADPPPEQNERLAIKKTSRVPGATVTQFVEIVPLGKSTPDFSRKPMPLKVQAGKKAMFKVMVLGNPPPAVVWTRLKCPVLDPEVYKTRYDPRCKEHILEMLKVQVDQADTYKCIVTNDYGEAVVTVTLNVVAAAAKNADGAPLDFRKMLKKTVVVRKKQLPPQKEGEIDPKLLELLLSAPKKDYERICFEFGVTDFRWLLKRLNQLKKEREDEQAKVVENLENVKQIEVKPNGRAEFELDMKLSDPNSQIELFKDGELVPYGMDEKSRPRLEVTGTKYLFSISDPQPDDAGFYQVDVGEANVLSTDFKVPDVDFNSKLQSAKATENEDAVFQCVLTAPMNYITWSTRDASLQHGDKYDVAVSEDKLTHTLRVKGCAMADAGDYFAIAGIMRSSAALTVEADPNAGKGGDQGDLGAKKKAVEEVARPKVEADVGRGDGGDGGDGGGGGDGGDGGDGGGGGDGGDGGDGGGGGDGGDGGDGAEGGDGGDGSGGKGDGKRGQGDGTDGVGKGGGEEMKKDPGVRFVSGLTDTAANVGGRAELSCKLSSDTAKGCWYKNGKPLTDGDGVRIVHDGACHRLIIDCCSNDDGAVYRFEAEGRKSEATLSVEDPPRIDLDALGRFSKPVIVRAGETAQWKLPFSGGGPLTVQWYKEDQELLPGLTVRTETSSAGSQLRLTKCQRKDVGEVKIKIKNAFGTVEAVSELIVLDKPTPPQGPVDVLECSPGSVAFKWKPPKDDGGCPVTGYILERQQVGRNKWTVLGEFPGGTPSYRDSDVDPGRRYCYRIRAKNSEGVSEFLETEDICAGVLRYPGSPSAPKVVSAFKDCINLTWFPPCDTGGSDIVGYNLEKRKTGSNHWSLVNAGGPIKGTKYAVKDVFEGASYQFRVTAVNLSGAGEPSLPCESVYARDPMKPPGKVTELKLTSSNYTTFSLAWTKPKEVEGVADEAHGYYVEIRQIEELEWSRCNSNPASLTSFTVLGLKAMAAYWVRVIATNYGGDGEPRAFDNYVIAMPPPVRPRFKDKNMKSFLVVKLGNTVRVNISFEACPLPEVSWLKDGVPVSKHVTITNSESGSQMLIPVSERSDTGIYTIVLKNMVGQETFDVEIRVTVDPKAPGPVELERNVPGTLTLRWVPSPDEKRDDRLSYVVAMKDSYKQTWRTVAENLFNHRCTVAVLPGREYYFRVFAKNDMGLSQPVESPSWATKREKAPFKPDPPEFKSRDLRAPPSFPVPLKQRTAPRGYECHMSCAVSGDPRPHVTWYRDNVSLNANANYHVACVRGVCTLLVLKVGAKDSGEYRVVADNPLGTAECSMTLNVRE